MKRITKEELPMVLTGDIINILIEMALEFPQTKEWHNIFDILEERGQLFFILDKVEERKKAIEQAKEDAKSDEQKKLEAEHNKKADELVREFYKKNGYYPFQGNMGEPVTLEDFKLKNGRYSPGYDENGNKI